MNDQTERVFLHAPVTEEAATWWMRYASTLTGLTATALSALRTDCSYIVDRGVLSSGSAGAPGWEGRRVRTGLVMGSVQSGKTASMFGVTALTLDQGIDVVVILAGTRLALWRQTYERLGEQLDAGDDTAAKAARRMLCPAPGIVLSGASGSLRDIYRLPAAQVRSKLARGRPIVIVAMKQADHLYALGSALRASLFDAVVEVDRPVHMLVLDDEADDGSVLDAAVESGRDQLSAGLKQIPRAIADLWEPRSTSAPANLFATYVGYTATPQANLLQEDHNPLAPRDFVLTLRTPFDVGAPVDPNNPNARRSSTYPEPAGLGHFYTGGEVFYRRGQSAELCVELSGQPDDDLGDALRAFLVAGAVRLHREASASGPNSLSTAEFHTSEAARAASPQPHSMLIHPAADIERHFERAEDVLLWAGVGGRAEARQLLESGDARLPDSLVVRMHAEEETWQEWLERYRQSSSQIGDQFNVFAPIEIPDWPTIRSILEQEVIPGTRVSVVNSDPTADDRPEYAPRLDGTQWRAARDLSTIFVAGNVLARGLTLEGLTTALFQRGSTVPLADTQMQMQRWFGYRGRYIELCRLFAGREQIELFRAYHDIDEAIRVAISKAMDGATPSPVVLHGLQFLATGKIANLGRIPLCPSARPFVTLINDGQSPDPNVHVVAELFASGPSSEVVVGSSTRGRALERSLSLKEAADVLDSFGFDAYGPGEDNRLGQLWSEVQARVGDVQPLPSGTQFYRPPGSLAQGPSLVRYDSPYAISAYLRLWEACLTRPVRGLFVTGAPSDLWSMADLHDKQLRQPRFSVGIRYGSGPLVTSGALAELDFGILATVKRVGTTGSLETEWGANDPTAGDFAYRGDEFFDYYHRGEHPPRTMAGSGWRPEGSQGQILFYINQLPGQPNPAVAVGVCIPAGGPEQFAATRVGALVAA